MFFTIIPISNTGGSTADILATVHFLHPKHGSSPDMETPNCVISEGAVPPSNPAQWGDIPLYNSSPALYLCESAAEKPSTFLAGLSLNLITNIRSASSC